MGNEMRTALNIQCIENIGTGDLIFYCIVDPAWREEDEIVFESESKP